MVHRNLAKIYLNHSRLEEVVYHLSAATRLKPEDFDNRLNLALFLVRLGKLDEAVTPLEEAIAMHPSQEMPRKRLAELNALRKKQAASDP